MPPADPVDHEQRVQPDERHRADAIEPSEACGVPYQPHDHQTRECGQRLVREHAGGDRQRRQDVAEDREHRPVGGGDVGPLRADVREHRIQRDRVRSLQVRVGAVGGADPGVGLVAEDVGREQRWAEQHERVQGPDRDQHGTGRQPGS